MPSLETVTPYLRHALQLGAGALVARGTIDASMAELLVGSVASAFAFAWMWFSRKPAKP